METKIPLVRVLAATLFRSGTFSAGHGPGGALRLRRLRGGRLRGLWGRCTPRRGHQLRKRRRDQPAGVAVTPDATCGSMSRTYSAIPSLSSARTANTVVATVPEGALPTGIAVTPDGKRVYVAIRNANHVAVISTATNTLIATTPPLSFLYGRRHRRKSGRPPTLRPWNNARFRRYNDLRLDRVSYRGSATHRLSPLLRMAPASMSRINPATTSRDQRRERQRDRSHPGWCRPFGDRDHVGRNAGLRRELHQRQRLR